MKILFDKDKKMLYLAFPVDPANITHTASQLKELLFDPEGSEIWKPVYRVYMALLKKAEIIKGVLQSTAKKKKEVILS